MVKKYFALYRKIKELEAQKKELSGHIIAQMESKGLEVLETDTGRLNLTRKKIWSYDPIVKDQIKKLQNEAKTGGYAKQKESIFLTTTIK